MTNDRIIMMGDTHLDFGYINTFINKHHPKMLIICGDFGYWPSAPQYTIIKHQGTKIHWCDGNHEDFWALKARKSNEIMPNVIYQPRGSLLTLPNSKVILFMGGAHSVDKELRTLGYDWFPEETISTEDFAKLPPKDTKIDIVVSHTCPFEFNPMKGFKNNNIDPSRNALSEILHIYKPKSWYYGHWHEFRAGIYEKDDWCCHWFGLNMTSVGANRCWMDLLEV